MSDRHRCSRCSQQAFSTQNPSRRTPTQRHGKVDECGPMHLIIGDAGNVEGIARKFMDTARPQPSYCATPTWYTQFPMP